MLSRPSRRAPPASNRPPAKDHSSDRAFACCAHRPSKTSPTTQRSWEEQVKSAAEYRAHKEKVEADERAEMESRFPAWAAEKAKRRSHE